MHRVSKNEYVVTYVPMDVKLLLQLQPENYKHFIEKQTFFMTKLELCHEIKIQKILFNTRNRTLIIMVTIRWCQISNPSRNNCKNI